MKRVLVTEFLQMGKNALLLDVRSPAEYNHAHIPGAVSFPLFTDEERKVVGTAYKQKSREAAIKIGLNYFGPKMRGMVENVEALTVERWPLPERNANNEQRPTTNVFIYCWRGGMRSGAVAWLLNLYGFNVTVLAGGYKAFRNHVLASFKQSYGIKILGGYTGSGKTELLQQLKTQGHAFIDLENLASHKGSAFGSINMPSQPTQEMFENLLSRELLNLNSKLSVVSDVTDDSILTTHNSPLTVWLEDESQRIGSVNIPGGLWEAMRAAPVYFLDVPFEQRLAHITEEYGLCNKERLADAILRIKKRLGPMETKTALQLLAEGNVKECFGILLQYYDKHYKKGLANRENFSSLLTTVSCNTVTTQNVAALLEAQYAV